MVFLWKEYINNKTNISIYKKCFLILYKKYFSVICGIKLLIFLICFETTLLFFSMKEILFVYIWKKYKYINIFTIFYFLFCFKILSWMFHIVKLFGNINRQFLIHSVFVQLQIKKFCRLKYRIVSTMKFWDLATVFVNINNKTFF